MKSNNRMLRNLFSTLIFAVSSYCVFAQSKPNHKAILDSLEVIKNVGGLVDGYTNPPTDEELRLYNITNLLFALPYAEIKKLQKDKSPISRAYGFSIMVKKYFDSITATDKEIFQDTARILIYTQRGLYDPEITLGQFCEMAYNSTVEERRINSRQPEVENVIKAFIKSNAKFPNSYKPIDFARFSWGSTDTDKVDFYEIIHKYSIKQNDGKEVEVSSYFVLNRDFKITVIEAQRSNIYDTYPPKIYEWINLYGKK